MFQVEDKTHSLVNRRGHYNFARNVTEPMWLESAELTRVSCGFSCADAAVLQQLFQGPCLSWADAAVSQFRLP